MHRNKETKAERIQKYSNARKTCHTIMDEVNDCENHFGIGHQQCMPLIIAEKYCLSEQLCPNYLVNINHFCDGKLFNDGSNSALQVFQKPQCRKALLDLTKCTSPYINSWLNDQE
eukprot:TRINITY_DN11901_c0_g1_i1.p1 TRINITY_DN11901_c0_g1~~TRINITY_DN11901_c0_g1_i1.p1  ORF type:complete len:115 (+),score=4.84 TRINITY_DN11901_c0_g1_i1:133-477(+)